MNDFPITCAPRSISGSIAILMTAFGPVNYNPRRKPRIELVGGYWVCHQGYKAGSGTDPISAYANWLRHDLGL